MEVIENQSLSYQACPRGHLKTPENTFGRNQCRICNKQAIARYELLPKRKKYKQSYNKSKPRKEYASKWYSKNRERMRNWSFKRRYGITLEELQILKEKQNYKCLICHKHETELDHRGLAVDHDHKSGKIRGLLCHTCNSHILSVVEKYSHLLPTALDYLKQYQ